MIVKCNSLLHFTDWIQCCFKMYHCVQLMHQYWQLTVNGMMLIVLESYFRYLSVFVICSCCLRLCYIFFLLSECNKMWYCIKKSLKCGDNCSCTFILMKDYFPSIFTCMCYIHSTEKYYNCWEIKFHRLRIR